LGASVAVIATVFQLFAASVPLALEATSVPGLPLLSL